MNVHDLFARLSYGELSNLSISGDGSGTIIPAARPKIILHTNEALLRLYSRFVLKEDDVLVELHDHITFYHLIPRYAVNYIPTSGVPNEPIRYLLDIPGEPFTGDVLKVLSVFNSEGLKLPLNDDELPHSLFTPQANILQVPNPKTGIALSVLYQAKHEKLQGELEEAIVLPDVLYGAMTRFIAYSIYSNMNTQESTAKAQEHLGLYEAICAEVTEKDLVNSSISASNTRFQLRGWV